MSTSFSELLLPPEEGGPSDPTPGLLEAINDEGLRRLSRAEEGAYNFTASMETVKAIRTMALGANEQDPLLVPREFHEKWKLQLTALGETLRRVQEFSPTADPTPNETHRTLIEEIDNHRDWFANSCAQYIRATGEINLEERTTAAAAAADKAVGAASQIDEILARLKTDAGESLAGELAEYYDGQATRHKDEARNAYWLTLGAIAFFAVLVAAFFWLWPIPEARANENEWERFIRGLAPRLLVLGLAAFALASSRGTTVSHGTSKSSMSTSGTHFARTTGSSERSHVTRSVTS